MALGSKSGYSGVLTDDTRRVLGLGLLSPGKGGEAKPPVLKGVWFLRPVVWKARVRSALLGARRAGQK
ncbi:hypothetical protein P7K49_026078 [Saguinus oedipus]|uniref:Uncharacterized protein n=1 Tax=Saguinus oedipus TaxID=9490 RepID=A0ABQ9UJU3_SAGOE|nr:hypothetical protein P7K49_026078 [Saguinus oedipus]